LFDLQLREQVYAGSLCSKEYTFILLLRIIEPLSSRCAKFRFRPLETSEIATRIKYIVEKEGVNIGEEVTKKYLQHTMLKPTIGYLNVDPSL
jgi:replication factor C subunit 2/4